MKVYIVTSGSYSDYHIDAVTLDKDQAERLAQAVTDYGWDEGHVTVWDTDDFKIIDDGMKLYYVMIFLNETGCDISRISIQETSPISSLTHQSLAFIDHSKFDESNGGGNIQFGVRARDEEHAKKIAYDKFAEWKAQKEGLV